MRLFHLLRGRRQNSDCPLTLFLGIVGVGLLSISFTTPSAHAAPKKIIELFPGLSGIDTSQVFDLSSAHYPLLAECSRTLNCGNTPPRFFQVSSSPDATDTFDLINRCMVVRGGKTFVTGLILLDSGARTVDCPTLTDEEVQVAHILVCYERSAPTPGAFCNLSSACFEGSRMKGACTKDYPGLATEIVQLAPVPAIPVGKCDRSAGGTACTTKDCFCASNPVKNVNGVAYTAACQGTAPCHSSCDAGNPMIKWQCTYSP